MGKKVIIIGGGPAGVSASLYTVRAGIDTSLIIYEESALDKAENIENYYGFPGGISGAELKKRGLEQARALGVKILEEEVVGLAMDFSDQKQSAMELIVKTSQADHPADAVIIAMGSQRKAPDVEGIKEYEGKGVSYCAVCDGFFYRGKTVAVLGSGEYADSEARELEPLAAEVIRLEDISAIKRFSGNIDQDADRLRRVEFKDGTSKEIDGLFIAYGTAGPGDLAKKIGIMTEGSRIIVDEKMATNVPGIFAAGDCTGGMLQVSKAVADGAKAAASAIAHLRSAADA
ncbi:MAG: NAD(P)/FAD-dependent oxidoreductase [Anaerovoracaceae bacterium]|nr:NAD(P)/FAD-dependent oxidoreductase [Anaerovoracaceae bacterium]